MANRRNGNVTYKGAIVDTAPGASGFYTEAVNARAHKIGKMFISIWGIFSATVSLQFKEKNDPTWTTYETYTDSTRQIIEDYTDCQWRIGIANGNFSSGSVRVRIEYFDGEVR